MSDIKTYVVALDRGKELRVVSYDHHIGKVEKLEQAVEFYRGASRNPHDIARINELEVTNSMLHDMISGMKRTTNEIQAQGIREMLCDNNYEESTGWIEEYANKLMAKQ